MKLPILFATPFAVLVAAAPATAQVKFDEKAGAWSITGEHGDCLAFLKTPQGMIAVLSPATTGENEGGIAVGGPGLSVETQETSLVLDGVSNFSGPMGVDPMQEGSPPIYWHSFPAATTIDSWPDSWRARLTRGGATVMEVKATGFTAARATLRRCIASTR